jgi:hypothetical protein
MALVTAQGIADVSIALLTRALTLPRTVTRIPGAAFAGPNGATITVLVPQVRSAREQSTPGATITYDAATEIPVDVSLKHLYNGHLITDEQATYGLRDFASQVLRQQVAAVATAAEDEIADAMNAVDESDDIHFATVANEADTIDAILSAREFLGTNDAPPGDRYAAVSPDIASRILSISDFIRVDATGTDDALREAIIGRLFGFTFVESNALDAGTAVFYHSSGFVFANRVPAGPRSDTADVATVTEGGIGLRALLHYVPENLSEASVVSTFAGAAAVVEDESDGTAVRYVKVGTGS